MAVTREDLLERVKGMEEVVSLEGGEMRQGGDMPVVRSLPHFDDFYNREFDAVAALAFTLSGSRIASDDLAQEAFFAAYRKWGEIGRYDNPGAWVRRVVANRAVSVVRRRVVQAKAVARLGGGIDPIPEVSADTVDVWREVRKLPKRQAQVIALYYLEDLSLDGVASVLDCGVETVRTHLRRGRKTLARRLDTEENSHGS